MLRAARALAERVAGLAARAIRSVQACCRWRRASAAAPPTLRRRLRALAHHNGLAIDDPRLAEAAQATGADVPVCLEPRARRMAGIGDRLGAPLGLPPIPAVLVNPRVASPTPAVFAGLGLARANLPGSTALRRAARRATQSPPLAHGRNDMQPSAERITPAISETLSILHDIGGAKVVRMSGSGATCFALYACRHEAARAARRVRELRPAWWVRGTYLR